MSIRWFVVFLLVFVPSLAAAQSPAETPPEPARQLQLGGYIQYDYLAPLGEEAATADTFRFRRVRLQGSGTINENIGWAVTIEATTTPFLRDAYVTLKYFPAATVQVGQFVMPYGQEQHMFSSNTLAFTERVVTEVIASRDAGIAVSNDRPLLGWSPMRRP